MMKEQLASIRAAALAAFEAAKDSAELDALMDAAAYTAACAE